MKGKIHDLYHDLKFSEHTINCGCHSIRSMIRVLGIYNFGAGAKALLRSANTVQCQVRGAGMKPLLGSANTVQSGLG